ncbi:hypothetical protein [Luteibacter sp. 22Crub2.1]|uniref:hypothetical protein n=1 Tax=Luteibacter sp. 22Crub2.1 TaxID=1283288 RepID=UPI0009A8BE7C|nr:hypothetical protein [Luteibacter sp. 22Crub2.1]SKB50497.1 hypothetical protein SAMN05660880_01354 [Luteibacter sp. 22Crub2.1]
MHSIQLGGSPFVTADTFSIGTSNALHHYRAADGALLKFKPIKERSRTYRYPDGSEYRVDNATLLCVRETSHRLVTADRKHIIVRGGFNAIEIDCDGWSA